MPRLAIAASLVWLGLSAFTFSNAGVDLTAFLIAAAFVAVWGSVWAIRLVLHVWRWRRDRIDIRSWWVWVPEPLVGVLCLLLAMFGVFENARFSLSEAALTAYAETVRAGEIPAPGFHAARWIGLYRVDLTETLPDGTVRIVTTGSGMFDRAGFAFAVGHAPQIRGEDYYEPLRGSWWIWQESW